MQGSSVSLPLATAARSSLFTEPSPLTYFIFTAKYSFSSSQPNYGRPGGTSDGVVVLAAAGDAGGAACRGHFIAGQ